MLQCLSLSFARLKSEICDHHKGRVELESMDDVLPLQLYCYMSAKLPPPAALHNMMSDYLRQQEHGGFDLERKLLCNLDCAVRYVCNEWEHEWTSREPAN
jgi:hypothetical protein